MQEVQDSGGTLIEDILHTNTWNENRSIIMALSKVDVANMVENRCPSANVPDVNFRNIIMEW